MKSSFGSVLVLTAVAAIALTSFDPRPAAAMPKATIAGLDVATELSAARKKRRYRGNPFPYAAVGAIIGSIANIAAAERRRAYYYDDGPYIYNDPNGELILDDSNLFQVPQTCDTWPTSLTVRGGYVLYDHCRIASPEPVRRRFVGRAPAARQFVQRNFVRPRGGRVGASGGPPHGRR
jgi:hypothetical protein